MILYRACTDPEQEDVKRKKVEASSVIKVTGLSSTISQSWIKSTFRRFGEVTNIEYSEEEGTVYIHFDTKEAADTACKKMNGEMVADKTLAVEIHQVSSRSMSTRVATTGEVPSTQFSFNLDKTPATASVPSPMIDFENLPSLSKSGTQSLFSRPVRGCALDLSTAHSAMLPTLTQQPVDPVKPQSTVAVTQAEVFTLSSSRYKEMAASKASSPHQAIQKCQQSSKDPQSHPSRVVQRGKAMEGKGASKSTTISTVECNTGYVSKPMKTSSPPSLQHAITYPAVMPTLNSSKSSDNQRAHVSRSIPPLMRRTQTEPIPSLSTTKDAKTEHETVPIVKKKDTTSEGDLEGNPFKQALSSRPSLALQAGVSSSIKPKKQVMATLSEVIEFSHPMYKRIITSKYKSDLEALQNRYKVLVGGKEVEGVALTLTGSSVGNVMQAKRELRTLERSIQGKISDSTFTLSCGFLPCLADIETVTRLQEIEKQNVVEFAVVTNTCETQLTQVRKMVKDKLADAKGPLCLSQVHSFTEMRLGYFWKVRNATSGEVVGFDSHTNDLINAAYIGRQSTCSFFYNGHSYTIDFSQMTVSDDAAQGPTHKGTSVVSLHK